MSKPNTDYASELYDAVKLFIDQPLNNPLTRSQIMDIARIALPVLEQKQRGEGEWIEWRGGRRPVDKLLMVEPKLRSGKVMPPEIALYWNWGHGRYSDDDIIAYRVVKS